MVRALEIDHPFTRTVTLAYAAMLGQFRRDVAEVDRLTRAAFAHATEHGFPYYRAWAEVLQGWSRAARGAGEEAIADMRRGIAALQASARLRLPYYRALLAESCGCIGRVDEGLDVLVEAFDDIRGTDERWWEPELHRIRGELLRLAARPSREPESCFRMAIDRAVQQRTRSLELRAAIGLARMQRDPSAHRLLAQTYGRFTEGFDTPDLIEAAGILAESGTTKVRRSG
jgi:adenylate cyclase